MKVFDCFMYLDEDLILDIIKPRYIVPYAGDFGWFHKFQYDHNF